MRDKREISTKLSGGKNKRKEEGKDAIVNNEQRDPWRRHGRKGEMGTIIPEMHSSHDGVMQRGFIRCISMTI